MKEKLERLFGFPRRDEWFFEHVYNRVYRNHVTFVFLVSFAVIVIATQVFVLASNIIK
jgi:hypothetical protein